jgi:hypothetical protein
MRSLSVLKLNDLVKFSGVFRMILFFVYVCGLILNSKYMGYLNRGDCTQLTLGQLIQKLEKCELTYGEENKPKDVCFDFGSAVPTSLDSWRGVYAHLALGYELSGRDNNFRDFTSPNVKDLLSELKSANGKCFTGWKGGEYYMNKSTPVWVANPGGVGHTAIVDVYDDGINIVLITAYWEY